MLEAKVGRQDLVPSRYVGDYNRSTPSLLRRANDVIQ